MNEETRKKGGRSEKAEGFSLVHYAFPMRAKRNDDTALTVHS